MNASPVAVDERGSSRLRRLSAALRPLRLGPDVARIVFLWAAWLAVICVFQIVVAARLEPQRPDNVLGWTAGETADAIPAATGTGCRPLLADPNMNEHVAFDSEYYIAIAVAGYDNPDSQAYVYDTTGRGVVNAGVPTCTEHMDGWTPLDYAFMPGYPTAMAGVMTAGGVVPGPSGLTTTGLATLCGIVVSALGGLLALLALARLMAYLERRRCADTSGDWPSGSAWAGPSGLRAALYLLVFPTGFYLAQVYSDGLFLGLAFMACALAVEKKIVGAAIFAGFAAITRQVGLFLFLPLAWSAFEILRDPQTRPSGWRRGVPVIATLVPVAVFAAWFLSPLGQNWQLVEREFFARSFDVPKSIDLWSKAVDSLVSGVDKTAVDRGFGVYGGGALVSSTSVYIALEFLSLALGVTASVWLLWKRMPGVALFGLGVVLLSAGSSGAQGMDRYVLAVPAIFLMLAWFGRNIVFDRVWVMASTLLMGMLAMLFTFGFWVS